MALSAGTRLGSYEILAAIDAGGMGEVYRARDTRLERTVAIKILPSADAELKARFAREGKLIAGLTHPHICTLYDVGQHEGTDYLVMEYLEGQTLAARLQRGPLRLDEALKCGREIADALDKAHRAGVVHRDLKPANIMLTRSGSKLLDFGVAKLRPAPAVGTTATVTGSTPLTDRGMIVGTPQYMAPEQLEGNEADARSDVFALGLVLYEMVTGRKAFQGSSPASLIAAIMSAEPPIAELRKLSPPGFAHLVQTCLIKNPENRRQSARDVLLQLEWIGEHHEQAPVSSARAGLSWKWVAASALLAVSSAMAGYFTAGEPTPQPMTVSLLPPGTEPRYSVPAISPDGTRVAFCARGSAGQVVLWIRSLESSTGTPLNGTEQASHPFWSPDSRSIGFFAQGQLKIIAADVGSSSALPRTLADAPEPRGATWSPNGVIVFARNIEDGLYRVSASGGDVTPVTTLDKSRFENSHRWPQFLPNGRQLLFLARSSLPEHQGIYVGTPGSQDWKLLLRTPLNALVAQPPRRAFPARWFSRHSGYLVFMRERTLMARPFDLNRLELVGEPLPIAESVDTGINRGAFSVSGSSPLAYRVATDDALRTRWFDRTGRVLESEGSLTGSYVRLSPDGKRAASLRLDPESGAGDIWLEDVSRKGSSRLTSHPGYDWMPVWSPDSARVAFASNREATMDLYDKAANGTGPERLLLKSEKRKIPTDWSRDGAFLLFEQEDATSRWDLWALPMERGAGDPKPFRVLQSEFNELHGVFSPNGRWLAYTSDETGRDQVYVVPFPGHPEPTGADQRFGGKTLVSPAGGTRPRWRSDGQELFYVSPTRAIVSVSVKTGSKFEVGLVTPLFESSMPSDGSAAYDVSPDGNRFLIPTRDEESVPLTLFLNWTGTLKK